MASAVALALASGAAIVLWRARRGPGAAWVALAVLAQGATLALIDAPPSVAYQHWRFDGGLLQWLALATLLACAAATGPHAAREVRAAWRRGDRRVPLLAVALMVGVTAAAPSRDPVQYVAESLAGMGAQAVVLAALWRATRADDAPAAGGLEVRWLGAPDVPGPQRPDAWVVRLALLSALASAVLSWTTYERHPHVPDEVVYLLQARYLAAGHLTLPLPPVPAGFNVDLMQYEPGRWYSPVNPGWPFVLAIGARLGAPWLVNPVLGGVAVVLCYLLLGHLYDRRTTRLATLLLAASPWFLFLNMSFMTHTATLVCALAAALGVARARAHGGLGAAFAGGLATGAVSLVRPLEGLALALLVGAWSLGARGARLRFGPSAALVAGSLATGMLALPYNALLTGSPRTFPIMAYTDAYYPRGSNALGFGADRGLGWPGLDPFPGHGAIDVVVNAVINAFQVNVEMLGWATGSVVFLALPFLLGVRGTRRADWWMLAAIAMIAGIHSLYWFSGGPDFGARYWGLVIVPCAALIARGLIRLEDGERSRDGAARRPSVVSVALLMMAASTLVFVPWRAVGKYRHYRGMRADVRALAEARGFGRSLVLVRGRRHPDYASAAIYNSLDLRDDAPVYAWDASPQIRERLLAAYPDRPVYVLDGPSISGGAFRVAAGPLTSDALRASGLAPDAAGDPHVWDPLHPPPPVAGTVR